MKKHSPTPWLMLLGLLLCSGITKAEPVSNLDEFKEKVLDGFSAYYDKGLDEKLYLQTDKPYYSAGENIWFKGFLLNAITHQEMDYSNFIYVELINPAKEVVYRVKVKRNETGFDGHISLDPKIQVGDYQIRAYTRWMNNNAEEFLFRKNINIISPIPADASEDEIDIRTARRARAEAAKRKESESAFAVQFFPESGSFVAGLNQVVAFKALGSDGLKVDVEGTLYNSKDEALTELKSSYKGMGSINIIPNAEESYYAMLKIEGSEAKRFDLPVVQAQGSALKISRVKDRLFYQAQASSQDILEGATLVVQSRGRILNVFPINGSSLAYLPFNQLYDGISVLSLVDANGIVVAERIVFKKPTTMPALNIKAGAENYAHRKSASFKIDVKDSQGNPAVGNFAISVTDDSAVRYNESSDNIISYLLLSSEIKGYIEGPNDYFLSDDAQTDRNLDLLMLTQGWRRFETQQVLDKTTKAHEFTNEYSASITGEVKGFFGNAARNPKLSIYCQKLGIIDAYELGTSNKFSLTDLNIPDSTIYILQAQGRKGGNSLELEIYPEVFPASPLNIIGGDVIKQYIPQAFIDQSQEKFYYDGGMTTIEMEAVYVEAETTDNDFYSSAFATASAGREKLELMAGQTILNVIRTFPSMRVSDEGVVHRGGNKFARFMIDGMEEEFEDIQFMMADQIETLNFFSGSEASMYSDAGGGVFTITLREGEVFSAKADRLNIARVSQLGYQTPAEFYQPSYDNPSVLQNSPPDYRTTIYWNGQARSNQDGSIFFNFFTADKATQYTITVEGVTEDGEICRTTSTMNRTLSM